MMNNTQKANRSLNMLALCTLLVVAAVMSRIINAETHWYNFGPMVAISIFSGAILKNKSYAYLLPLAAYFVSDLYLEVAHGAGFYGISQFFVYGGMALVVLLGTAMRKQNVARVLGFSIGGSLLFWIVSNFGVFLGGYWGTGLDGLATTYLMALPFYSTQGSELFLNAFVGDLLFSGILFGAYALLKSRFVAPRAIAR
jgi:hypothetical protein